MTIERLTGTKLGSYEVRELLGSGGMAAVYKGYDPALDREVAIKVLGTTGQPGDFVARFQREARVVARLRHPNIVQIYHFGGQREIVYMVQELLAGPTLALRIRETGRRRMAAERVHTTIAQLATALDFAHGQGVIHRDVKPSNALYNLQGQLVLTDFGIARVPADATRTTTGPGVIMGTPGYLAPEQAISSATLSPACDIYALGVVLFELLTGRLPFEADTPMGVVLKHLYDEPPAPSSLRPELPAALDSVVLRALSKEPAARYASAGALAKAIQAAWPAGRATSEANQRAPRATRPAPTRSTAPRKAAATPPKMRPGASAPPPGRRVSALRPTTARAATPATQASRRASPQARMAAAKPAPATAARHEARRRRVGILTADIVGALILFGMRPNALAEAWSVIRRLIGG